VAYSARRSGEHEFATETHWRVVDGRNKRRMWRCTASISYDIGIICPIRLADLFNFNSQIERCIDISEKISILLVNLISLVRDLRTFGSHRWDVRTKSRGLESGIGDVPK
jgi:hypothetical protein